MLSVFSLWMSSVVAWVEEREKEKGHFLEYRRGWKIHRALVLSLCRGFSIKIYDRLFLSHNPPLLLLLFVSKLSLFSVFLWQRKHNVRSFLIYYIFVNALKTFTNIKKMLSLLFHKNIKRRFAAVSNAFVNLFKAIN